MDTEQIVEHVKQLTRGRACCFSLLGLRVPPSCELVVGGEPQYWSEGTCLLFDDSFLHRAFHEGEPPSRPLLVSVYMFFV